MGILKKMSKSIPEKVQIFPHDVWEGYILLEKLSTELGGMYQNQSLDLREDFRS